MSESKEGSNVKTKSKPPKAEYIGSDPLKEAVGIWKDKWPKDMSSVEVARKMREQQWKRS